MDTSFLCLCGREMLNVLVDLYDWNAESFTDAPATRGKIKGTSADLRHSSLMLLIQFINIHLCCSMQKSFCSFATSEVRTKDWTSLAGSASSYISCANSTFETLISLTNTSRGRHVHCVVHTYGLIRGLCGMWKTLQNKKQAATLGNDGCRCSKFQRIGLTLAASGLVDEYSSIVVRLAETS